MRKVLIVDDKVESILPVITYMKNIDYKPFIAFDGIMALSLYKKHFFDKLIIDWNMPAMNGKSLIVYLDAILKKKNLPNNAIAYLIYSGQILTKEDMPITNILKLKKIINKSISMSEQIKIFNSFLK